MFQPLPPELQALISVAKLTTCLVVDKHGSSVNAFGNSAGIGNESDLALLRFIRAQSEIVLTSGKTARADDIRMPRAADLAIFTAAGVQSLRLEPKGDQSLVLIGSEQATNYLEALSHIRNLGYQNIQIEFGISGLSEVLQEIDVCVISGQDRAGVELFLEQQQIIPSQWFELKDLFVAVGSGRGKGEDD